jgi:hypothetical protein
MIVSEKVFSENIGFPDLPKVCNACFEFMSLLYENISHGKYH